MNTHLHLRDQYGDIFVTEFPDGPTVPWRPLTTQEFLDYDELIKSGRYPLAYVENEVFKKCVRDEVLVTGIGKLKAGIVEAVAATILSFSGPRTAEEIQEYLDYSRVRAHNVVHQFAGIITQAFPAYTPEQVYDLPFSTFMLRVAQSEEKLLRMGLISEPLSILEPDQKGRPKKRPPKHEPPKRDLFNEWQQTREEAKTKTGLPMPLQPPPLAPEYDGQQTIIDSQAIAEHSIAAEPHMKEGMVADKLARETAELYPDYLEQMSRGEKPKIATVEERIAAAKKRSEERAVENEKVRKETLAAMKVERKKLLEVRAAERKRRAKKARRRR